MKREISLLINGVPRMLQVNYACSKQRPFGEEELDKFLNGLFSVNLCFGKVI